MSLKSKIEWTEASWNPITGCTKISDGCANCYAARLAKRLNAMHNPRYTNVFNVTIHKDLLEEPKKWKKPLKIFVNSMSDIFHEDIPDDIIIKIFETMNECPQHRFQILTKRPERLVKLNDKITWSNNIWMGVTIESYKYVYRADLLRTCGAKIKFVSAEPLLSNLESINLLNIDWIIVGGESGPNARPMSEDWVQSLLSRSRNYNTAFFFKQWGGKNKKKNGRLLNGRTYDEYPDEN